MSEEDVNTVQLHAWVDRMRAGDLAARDELLRKVCDRMERLARKMLRRFPDVRRWADTDDVFQNAMVRFLRALEEVRPDSVRSFFGLAAEQMRRELLDLARHYRGPQAAAAHHESGILADVGQASAHPDEAEDLDRWAAFHQRVAELPAEEREVVSLVFYHGWTQVAVAELFEVSVRTVQRRWESALLKLRGSSHGSHG
jgi:RNA polymerase sigma factor (sigma-70 family)